MQPQREKRREVKALRRGTMGPDALAIIGRVAAHYDLPIERLLRGKEYGLQARSIAMWTVWHICQLTLRDIGTIFGGMDYAAVAQRVRRVDRDDTVRRDLTKLLKKCQNI
jgi:chromosomal replication initiation ATPase DnaA